MLTVDIDTIIKENFDINDRVTRKTIVEADDSERNQILTALTSKLYDQIVSKVDDIDFATIPRSRGDITKIENYAQLMECIEILRGIVVQNRQSTTPIDILSQAVNNLIERKSIFTKAFAVGIELPILTYNMITLAIVSSVSYLIAGCIEYIKNPGADTFEIALDKVAYNKTMENLLFENLAVFNEGCKKGDMDKAMDHVIRNYRIMESSNLDESNPCIKIVIKYPGQEDREMEISKDEYDRLPIHDDKVQDPMDAPMNEDGNLFTKIGFGLLSVFKLIIPMIRSLVYFFYYSKQRMSDYIAVQAELIEMNAYKVQYNSDIADDKRQEIYKRQMNVANMMRNISNRFSVNYNKAKKDAANLYASEKKKFKVEEFPEITPSSTAVSSLF